MGMVDPDAVTEALTNVIDRSSGWTSSSSAWSTAWTSTVAAWRSPSR
jgi:hypothetical protein